MKGHYIHQSHQPPPSWVG